MKSFPLELRTCAQFLMVSVSLSACLQANDPPASESAAKHHPGDHFPRPVNTQAAGEHPPAPAQMPALFELPAGFEVKLFAGEPDVQQPIAFEFDDRGRVWVAENYSYGAHGRYDPELRDRIVILHDTDGDGQHDVRRVFWDQGWMLTSLAWGDNGLWILNDGTLSFLPDANRDDIPDSEPIEMLNGWTKGAGHNFVNGLTWGSDGWLYGRHGITDTSLPGTPETPREQRQPMNCGIWRFHPVHRTFEIVCHGTTNPWGLDENDAGDLFMSNNVIGHLWHVIPGAHYERMFGQDFNPHLYELMEQCADHYHWDHTGSWTQSRNGAADSLGGGHSHCGLLIYRGQNFPHEYYGKALMCNTHGRCVNVDRLETAGSTYVGKHEPEFLKVHTPWFRGVELKCGPAGCVYLSDWSDNGECHDHDGVHRTSGRIYRICYTAAGPVSSMCPDLAALSFEEIVRRALAPTGRFGVWQTRRARRLVLERFANASPHERQLILAATNRPWSDDPATYEAQQRTFSLAAALEVCTADQIRHAIQAPNPLIRRLAVRYVADHPQLLPDLCDALDNWFSQHEDSPAVLLAFAGAVQKIHQQKACPDGNSFPATDTLRQLCRLCGSDAALQRMTWYAVLAVNNSENRVRLKPESIPDGKVRAFQARWMAAHWKQHGDQVINMLKHGPSFSDAGTPKAEVVRQTRQLLQQILLGLQGQILPRQNVDWQAIQQKFAVLADSKTDELVSQIAAIFGSEESLARLRSLLKDRNADPGSRSRAAALLAEQHDARALPVMLSLLNDRAVYADVAAALAAFDDPRIPKELLKRWNNLRHGSREAAADTLCSRRSYALQLADALQAGKVTADQLTASQVRQLLAFNDPNITRIVQQKWGVINESSTAKAAAIERWKRRLTPETLAYASLQNGAEVFRKTCAACHRMYGQGGTIGPDLTGGNRGNIDYLLQNIIDPSAVVPKQFTLSTIVLKSGRLVNGVVLAETAETLTIQTEKEQKVLAVSDIVERVRTTRSLMPDGLLDSLTPEQVRDLIAWLMHGR